MDGKVKTNPQKGSITSVPHKRKIRLLVWGGAATPGDNSAFQWASRNVTKSYETYDRGNFVINNNEIHVATDIISHINRQNNDSIRSLDIFTHGGPQALYLTTANRETNQILRYALHNSSLYRTRTKMIFNAAGWTDGSALISDIDFSKFSTNAKIELHGCKTANTESDADNIAADFSIRLYEAGKVTSVVIGHADSANPNIKGGGEKINEQDYRHGKRVVFSNGRIIKTTRDKGHINEKELEGLAGKET